MALQGWDEARAGARYGVCSRTWIVLTLALVGWWLEPHAHARLRFCPTCMCYWSNMIVYASELAWEHQHGCAMALNRGRRLCHAHVCRQVQIHGQPAAGRVMDCVRAATGRHGAVRPCCLVQRRKSFVKSFSTSHRHACTCRRPPPCVD